jgi:hypothetical protein
MMYGCCHDEVLKHFPQFKQFIKLIYQIGVPMYAVENGFIICAKVLTINKGPQNRILQILQNYTLQ